MQERKEGMSGLMVGVGSACCEVSAAFFLVFLFFFLGGWGVCVWNWLMFLLVEIPVSPSMFLDQLILFFLFEPLKDAKMI